MLTQDPQRPTHTVFYPLRGGVSVTDELFRVGECTFAVADLVNLEWGPGHAQLARLTTIRIVAVEAALVTAIVAIVPSLIAVVAVVAYLIIATTMVRLSFVRWPTPLKLCAEHRGEFAVLYSSTNHTTFHQVCRALLRAVELHQRRIML